VVLGVGGGGVVGGGGGVGVGGWGFFFFLLKQKTLSNVPTMSMHDNWAWGFLLLRSALPDGWQGRSQDSLNSGQVLWGDRAGGETRGDVFAKGREMA